MDDLEKALHGMIDGCQVITHGIIAVEALVEGNPQDSGGTPRYRRSHALARTGARSRTQPRLAGATSRRLARRRHAGRMVIDRCGAVAMIIAGGASVPKNTPQV